MKHFKNVFKAFKFLKIGRLCLTLINTKLWAQQEILLLISLQYHISQSSDPYHYPLCEKKKLFEWQTYTNAPSRTHSSSQKWYIVYHRVWKYNFFTPKYHGIFKRKQKSNSKDKQATTPQMVHPTLVSSSLPCLWDLNHDLAHVFTCFIHPFQEFPTTIDLFIIHNIFWVRITLLIYNFEFESSHVHFTLLYTTFQQCVLIVVMKPHLVHLRFSSNLRLHTQKNGRHIYVCLLFICGQYVFNP